MSASARLRSDPVLSAAMTTKRYAVYFAPERNSMLHFLGSSWLGRDAFGGEVAKPDFVAAIEDKTRDARRYGFHGTLKAPMALRESLAVESLVSDVSHIARQCSPIEIELRLALIDDFLALVPAHPSLELEFLAARCTEELDPYRMPESPGDVERRRRAGLSERQERNLQNWGYPYVFEDFSFHLTLTRRLTKAEAHQIIPLARAHFDPILGAPTMIDALTIFVEPMRGADFIAYHRAPFNTIHRPKMP